MAASLTLRVLPTCLLTSALQFRPVPLNDGSTICRAYFDSVDLERYLVLTELVMAHRLRRMHLKVQAGTWRVLEIGPYCLQEQ